MPRKLRYDFWKKPKNYNERARVTDLFGNEVAQGPWDGFHYSPNTRTLADELKTLRKQMAESDADPMSHWPARLNHLSAGHDGGTVRAGMYWLAPAPCYFKSRSA